MQKTTAKAEKHLILGAKKRRQNGEVNSMPSWTTIALSDHIISFLCFSLVFTIFVLVELFRQKVARQLHNLKFSPLFHRQLILINFTLNASQHDYFFSSFFSRHRHQNHRRSLTIFQHILTIPYMSMHNNINQIRAVSAYRLHIASSVSKWLHQFNLESILKFVCWSLSGRWFSLDRCSSILSKCSNVNVKY